MRIFSAAIVASLGLASVQPNNEAVTSYSNQMRKIQQSFLNFLKSIGKNDAKQSENYHTILEKETKRERQAFDSMKEEFQSARLQNVLYEKNSRTDKDGAALKRESQKSHRQEIFLDKFHDFLQYYHNINTRMSPGINNLLRDIDDGKALLDSAHPLSSVVFESLCKPLMVQCTYHSNAIEGNSLTLKETEAVMNGLIIPGKTPREVNEIKGHQKALKFIRILVKKKQRLTESDILEIHGIMLHKIMPKDAGRYRRVNVIVGNPNPPHYKYVNDYMASLMEWYRQARDIHPVKRIAIFHARFEMIHPFIDDNGRTGRLILILELMKLGYPPGIIRVENSERYYNAIRAAYENRYEKITTEIAVSVKNALDTHIRDLKLRKKA